MENTHDTETEIANLLSALAQTVRAPAHIRDFAFGCSWHSSTQTFLWSCSGTMAGFNYVHGGGRTLGLAFQAMEADAANKIENLRAQIRAMGGEA